MERATLSPRENTANLMAGRPAERVSFHDNIWGDAINRWVTEGYPVKDGVPVDPADHFGYDLALMGGINPMPLLGPDELVEESNDWAITRNGAGAIARNWKGKNGVPEHIGFDLTSREIWDNKYRDHLLKVDGRRLNIDGCRQVFQKAKDDDKFFCYHHALLWENMRSMLGDECMLENMCLDPGWIHDYNRVYVDFYMAHYRVLFEEIGMPDGISVSEDLAYNKGLLCSPKQMEELFLPYFSEFVEFCHSFGLSVTIHSDGDIREAIPVILEAGFDGINPMEVKAGCDTLELADKYSDKLAFKGGLDVRVLESGDRGQIKKEVAELVNGMTARGARYIFGSDHSVSSRVSYNDFLYAVEVYRENMNY